MDKANGIKEKIVDDTFFSANKNITEEIEKSLLHLDGLSGTFYPHNREKGGYVELLPPERNQVNTASLPLPPPKFREWYGMKGDVYIDKLYLEGGKVQTDLIRKILLDDNFVFGEEKHIFELGCAGARMLRWFEKEASMCECWGCDVNAEAIVWCQQNLSPPFHFFLNTTSPHLPFSDGYYSFIFAGSVFTHIGELADAWLLELKRILNQKGRIFITVFDEVAYEKLQSKFPEALAVNRLKELNNETGVFDKPYGKFVYSKTPRQQRVGYRRSYLCNKLNFWFDIKGIFDCAYGWLTGILLSCK